MEKKTCLLAILLLFLFTVLALTSMLQTSVTSDEPNYVTAGYSYWKTGDFRLNFEHPPLAKVIAGFPLLFLKPELQFDADWERAKDPYEAYKKQWDISGKFFYYSGNAPEQLLFFARLPFLLLGIILGIYVFQWASALYGEKAGLFALFLYAFSSLMLAYTTLAITDFALSVFFFIAVYYFWKWRKEKTVLSLSLCGIFFGFANATKLTGLYLVPVFILLLFLEFFVGEKKEKNVWGKEVFSSLSSFFFLFLLGFFVVSLTYFFINIPLYKDALAVTSVHSQYGHTSYLLGEYGTEGWWWYFIVAFLVKTPIPFLVLLLASLFFFRKTRHKEISYELMLIIPAVFYFAMFMLNNINIGIRHILPIYPFLFVFSSKIVNLQFEGRKQQIARGIFFLLCFWYIAAAIFIYPHYLSYFNEIIGGPNNGQKVLLDSNIDWGQDVGALMKWLDENNLKNQSIYFSVFTIQPIDYLEIQNKTIKCTPHPGLFAVSVNRLYDVGQVKQGCLDWLKAREPDEKIGYSIFIYNITDPELLAQQTVCTYECQNVCTDNNKTFSDYIYVNECVCVCE